MLQGAWYTRPGQPLTWAGPVAGLSLKLGAARSWRLREGNATGILVCGNGTLRGAALALSFLHWQAQRVDPRIERESNRVCDPDKEAPRLKLRFQQVTRRLEWRNKRRRLWRVIRISAAAMTIVAGVAWLLIKSPWPATTTIRHFAAAPNCAAARAVGLAPSRTGQPGYWSRHDRDNDGIACEPWPRPR